MKVGSNTRFFPDVSAAADRARAAGKGINSVGPECVFGTTNSYQSYRINQVANFAPTDWATNIHISDRAPKDYWQELVDKRSQGEEWLKQQMYWHAIPEGWEDMDYDEFLSNRRKLIAVVIRDAFAHITADSAPVISTTDVEERAASRTLQEFFEAELLKSGDLLDPVDPDWIVDAVINEDGHLVIDGINVFDSLDEAAHSLGVTNLRGEEFWALEDGDDLVPLSRLSASS